MISAPPPATNKQGSAYSAGCVFLGREAGGWGESRGAAGWKAAGGGSIGRSLARMRGLDRRAGGWRRPPASTMEKQALSARHQVAVATGPSQRGAGMADFRRFSALRRIMAGFATAAGKAASWARIGAALVAAGSAAEGGVAPLSRAAPAPYARFAGRSRNAEKSAPADAPATGRSAEGAVGRNGAKREPTGTGSGVRGAVVRGSARGAAIPARAASCGARGQGGAGGDGIGDVVGNAHCATRLARTATLGRRAA